MPLIRIEHIAPETQVGLWQMTESLDELFCPPHIDLSCYHSEVRVREILTTYELLRAMTGKDAAVITHSDSGRPLLEGYHISISHTRGWAAVILSTTNKVAIDIEYYSDRVSRVAERFIRPDEDGGTLQCQLINWSAKETVYKYYSEENLQYFEMKLQPFIPQSAGQVKVEDLKIPKAVTVNYCLNQDFVLTYCR